MSVQSNRSSITCGSCEGPGNTMVHFVGTPESDSRATIPESAIDVLLYPAFSVRARRAASQEV